MQIKIINKTKNVFFMFLFAFGPTYFHKRKSGFT